MFILFRGYQVISTTFLVSLLSLTRADLISDFKSHGINILTSSDPTYANASIVWNNRFTYKPAVIAFPRTTKDVSNIVKISRDHSYTVTTRSGGHSYIANAMAGEVVVDLRSFNTVSLNRKTNIATIGPGIRLGDLILQLDSLGRAMPHGLCPFVGMGGHVAHGGYGYTSRQWGLLIDVVQSIEIVLSDGQIITASATSRPDLFWALRGAGSSFGIMTSIAAKTFPVPPSVTSMQYAWDMSVEEATSAVLDWQSFALSPSTPDEIGAYLVL